MTRLLVTFGSAVFNISVIILLRHLPTVITHAAIHLFGLGWHVWYAFHKVGECMRRGKTVELTWTGRNDLWFNGIIWINRFLQDTHMCWWTGGLSAGAGEGNRDRVPSRVSLQWTKCEKVPSMEPFQRNKCDNVPSSGQNAVECPLLYPFQWTNMLKCSWMPLQWPKYNNITSRVPLHWEKHDKVPSIEPFQYTKKWLSAL